jgi:hypothetical protein
LRIWGSLTGNRIRAQRLALLITGGRERYELLEKGDVDGSAISQRILAAVKELRRGRREGEPLD